MGCSCYNYKQTFTEEWGQKYFTIFLPKYCNFSPTKQFFCQKVYSFISSKQRIFTLHS